MSPAQTAALCLMEIQEARDGWVRLVVLEGLCVKMATLRVLERDGMVESKIIERSGGRRPVTEWRLTASGTLVAKRERARLSGNPDMPADQQAQQ